MSDPHKVSVDNGKYTFVAELGRGIRIDRGGRDWIPAPTPGGNAVHALMCELDAARVVLAAARASYERGDLPASIVDALDKHERLVDDREHPSEWAVPSEPRKP